MTSNLNKCHLIDKLVLNKAMLIGETYECFKFEICKKQEALYSTDNQSVS